MNTAKRRFAGFTLVELLVVIAIIGILAAIGIGSYGSIQSKARDARRKSDLENIARALEMYYNDNKKYPADNGSGQISGVAWGSNWPSYMDTVPKDTKFSYYYEQVDNKTYRLFARLENKEDPKVARDTSVSTKNPGTYTDTNCGSSKRCNYGISTGNTSLPTIADGDY